MAAVLGVSAHYHDSAAALVVDGRVVAAQQEERLSRQKNDGRFPRLAIDACMRIAGIDSRELDRVVFYENPYRKLERVLVESLRSFPRGAGFFRTALRKQLGEKVWVLDSLAEHCGVPRKRVEFVEHHESHAASALFCAPFDDAAALTVDGVGEKESTAIWSLHAGAPKRLASIEHPHSLGLFYAAVTAYLGFRVNEGEYKVMGLAAFGEPRHRDVMDSLLRVGNDGSFTLDTVAFAEHVDLTSPYGPQFISRFGREAREHRRPWALNSGSAHEPDQFYADVAASAQGALEDALLALACEAHRRTGASNLALAGGVALNCRANARLLAETPFERVYVHPAAGDAGGALGAALLGAHALGDSLDARLPAGLGVSVNAARALDIAAHLGLVAERTQSPAEEAAEAIARGRLVAWASGPCEWGPRALGHRSLLARADDAEVRDDLNRRIKGREAFRPFAPALTPDQASRFLHEPANDMTPRMTTTCRVVDGAPLEGCTHINGTSRAQTVEPLGPLLPVLDALEERDVHGVLNTSLNVAGEPMAGTETDALDFFVRRKPDVLFVDDVKIWRPS